MAYKNIEDRRTYHREYMREYRKWLSNHHFCAECKKQDAYTLAGRYRCFECTEKRRKTEWEAVEIETKDMQPPPIPREEWVAHGLCAKCGKRQIANIDLAWELRKTRLCEECYKKASTQAKAMAAKHKADFTGRNRDVELSVRLALWERGIKPRN
jgi:hypothetical protein